MDYSPPGSSVLGILQARILEMGAIPFSRGSSNPEIKLEPPALQVDSLPGGLEGRGQTAVYWGYPRLFVQIWGRGSGRGPEGIRTGCSLTWSPRGKQLYLFLFIYFLIFTLI